MERDEALRLLRSGREGVVEWNAWRLRRYRSPNHPGISLSGVDLSGCNLVGAQLRACVRRLTFEPRRDREGVVFGAVPDRFLL